MADIATLGLAVDSRQVTSANAVLEQLAAISRNTAANVTLLEKAFGNVESKARPARKAIADVTTQTGLARHELINLSRQVQDVGVSLASGQSPLMVLVQQGTQVADIFASSKGSVSSFATQLRAMVPTSLLVAGGLAAVGAAAYAAYSYWKNFALQLDDTARIAGTTITEMSKLQQAAAFKGISSDESAKGFGSFSKSVYDAQNGMGQLAEVFRVNNKQAGDFNESLANAADLIQRASSDQQRLQLLQQMGLPATMEWVRLLSGGADGLKRAKDEAATFGGAVDTQMIAKARAFDDAWNKTWAVWGVQARSAVSTVGGWIDDLIVKARSVGASLGGERGAAYIGKNLLRNGMGTKTPDNFDDFYGSLGIKPNATGKDKATVDPNAVRNSLSQEQQRIGILGNLATVQQTVRAQEIAIQQARLSGISITDKEAKAVLDYTRAQALGTLQIHAQADSYRMETEALTMDVGAATAFRAEQERLADFRARGITLTKDQAAALHDESAALGVTAQKSNDMRTRMDMATDFTSGFAKDLRAGTSALDALTNGLSRLADQLIDMAAKKLVQSAFGGTTGSFFGGGSAVPTVPSAKGNAFYGRNVIPFANGGVVTRPTVFPMANGAGLMGEAGPEAVMPLTRLPSGKLGVASRGNSSPNIKVNVVNNHSGASVSEPAVTDDGNGGLSIDMVVAPLENAMADRMTRGKGSLGKAARGMPSGRLLRG